MANLQVNQIIKLTIHNLGHNGEGIGSYEGYKIFVDNSLPGEIVEVRLDQCYKSYAKATLLNILAPSLDRINPPCPLFGKCGGCQLMHLSYSSQLEIKRQRVIDALQRIGKIHEAPVAPCLPSLSSLNYRNKIQLPVQKRETDTVIGLYARSSHDLVEIDHCKIHCSLGENVYKHVLTIIKNSDIEPYDPVTAQGELRHILIKSAIHTNQALVILVTTGKDSPALTKIAKEIMAACPEVKGVIKNINPHQNNVILGRVYERLEGAEFIQDSLCNMHFKVSPASFFQVNPKQAENLYLKALEFAQLNGNEIVLDAYCGVGTLSLIFAKHAKQVIGVECVPEAIVDARHNAILNEISNTTFVCEKAENAIKKIKNIDLMILNPPRKGCEFAFLEGIKYLMPPKLIYISCDPATLARDLAILKSYGYIIDAVQPFDMFPQTAHVETLVKIRLATLHHA